MESGFWLQLCQGLAVWTPDSPHSLLHGGKQRRLYVPSICGPMMSRSLHVGGPHEDGNPLHVAYSTLKSVQTFPALPFSHRLSPGNVTLEVIYSCDGKVVGHTAGDRPLWGSDQECSHTSHPTYRHRSAGLQIPRWILCLLPQHPFHPPTLHSHVGRRKEEK